MSTTDLDLAALISLRVLGVEPHQVTSKLCLEPTSAQRKGTEKIGRGGKYAPQRQHLWLIERRAHTAEQINSILHELIKTITTRREGLNQVTTLANKVDIVIGLFLKTGTGGIYLDPHIMAELSGLGIGVSLDVYCLDEGDMRI